MHSRRELLPWAAAIRGRLGDDPVLFDAHAEPGVPDDALFGNPSVLSE